MAEEIKLPGLGPTKKVYVYAGAGVLAVAVGIYYYRKRRGGGAGGTSPDQSNIDPATGFPEGSPEDLQALAQQQFEPNQPVGVTGPPSQQTPTYTYPSATYATNDAWAQGATDYLVNVEDQQASAVGPALALYLAGEPVTAAQKVIIEMARAIAGSPPQAGPNGYPPSIKEVVAPTTVKLAKPRLARSGGGAIGRAVVLSWNKIPNAGYYTLHRNGRPDHNVVGATSYRYTEHTRGVNWAVQARGAGGTHFVASDLSNTVTVP
jgi:hypothetical protein